MNPVNNNEECHSWQQYYDKMMSKKKKEEQSRAKVAEEFDKMLNKAFPKMTFKNESVKRLFLSAHESHIRSILNGGYVQGNQ